MTILTDKEETGSDGNTGLNSSYLPYFIADLAKVYGLEGRNVISASECLSADVNAAYDPTFPDGYERNNCSFVNKGIVVTKYTGARGSRVQVTQAPSMSDLSTICLTRTMSYGRQASLAR